jgi:hypothetical protein
MSNDDESMNVEFEGMTQKLDTPPSFASIKWNGVERVSESNPPPAMRLLHDFNLFPQSGGREAASALESLVAAF